MASEGLGFLRSIPVGWNTHWSDGSAVVVPTVELWSEETIVVIVGPRLARGEEGEVFNWSIESDGGVESSVKGFGGSGGEVVRHTLRLQPPIPKTARTLRLTGSAGAIDVSL